ncbi:unnamed protein product [Caenorhabditis auriculariae]|uniref:Uncharacterized protein n=1 Tax=Caenorhabditis auriculariae TaxID=2777116 RepID=A0A8S1H6M6_9PELO|nr:unnamed protein product [Caenorhabditis auriculariae]
MYLPEPQRQCTCHENDPPPWTGEIHGLSQVDSLELPAITICPKVPDSFNRTGLIGDVTSSLPEIDDKTVLDLIRFFIAGSGLENMNDVPYFNRTYLSYLNNLYKIWSEGYTVGEFFDLIQTEADDIGRIVFHLKASSSVTYPDYNYTQPQIIVYITDNHDFITDFPRFYLYPHEWNRMRFTARYIELIQKRRLLPFNCTLPYLQNIPELPPTEGVCRPDILADNYLNTIQLIFNSAEVKEKYEYVKEVYTTSVPGFMSQIGGQFGFFLGLSIITLLQMVIYGVHTAFQFIRKRILKRVPFAKVHPVNADDKNVKVISHVHSIYPPEVDEANDRVATLSRRILHNVTNPPSPVSTIIDSVDLPPDWGAQHLNRMQTNPIFREKSTSVESSP